MTQKKTAAILIGIYVFLRMLADPFFWRNLSEYYSYAFEFAFVLISWIIFRSQIKLWAKPTHSFFAFDPRPDS